MHLSLETIIAILGVVVALPPSVAIIWAISRRYKSRHPMDVEQTQPHPQSIIPDHQQLTQLQTTPAKIPSPTQTTPGAPATALAKRVGHPLTSPVGAKPDSASASASATALTTSS